MILFCTLALCLSGCSRKPSKEKISPPGNEWTTVTGKTGSIKYQWDSANNVLYMDDTYIRLPEECDSIEVSSASDPITIIQCQMYANEIALYTWQFYKYSENVTPDNLSKALSVGLNTVLENPEGVVKADGMERLYNFDSLALVPVNMPDESISYFLIFKDTPYVFLNPGIQESKDAKSFLLNTIFDFGTNADINKAAKSGFFKQ